VNQGFGLCKGETMTDTWRQVKSTKPDTDPLTDLKKEIEELISTSKAVLEAKEKAATKTSDTMLWVGTGLVVLGIICKTFEYETNRRRTGADSQFSGD